MVSCNKCTTKLPLMLITNYFMLNLTPKINLKKKATNKNNYLLWFNLIASGLLSVWGNDWKISFLNITF